MADTQGEGSRIFRQSAMSRISSADDLDKYIKVTNPSAWVVLVAALLLIGGLIVWSATAIIPTTVSVTGVLQNGTVTCWVDADTCDKIRAGGVRAEVLDTPATDIQVADMPMSAAEVKHSLSSDYESESLKLTDWNYMVTMTLNNAGLPTDQNVLVPVDITVSETQPINLVLGSEK